MGNIVTIDKECGCRVVNAMQCCPTRQFISFCPLHESALGMSTALQKVVNCNARFHDPTNCVEVMTQIARGALPAEEPKQ